MLNRELPPIIIDEDTPVYRRIAWWVENAFIRIFKAWFNVIQENLRKLISYALGDWLEDIEIELLDISEPFIDYVLELEHLPDSIRTMLVKTKEKTHPAAAIVAAVLIPVGMALLSKAINESVGEIIAQGARLAVRPTKLDPYTAMQLLNRGEIDVSKFRLHMMTWGWPNDDIDNFLRLRRPLWDIGELREGFRRGIVTDDDVTRQLNKMGFDDQFISLWKQHKQRIPSPAELVGIATREGFDDGVAARFGYDDNFPIEAAEWGEKQGLDREWFVKLWRAHWRLPGVSQGFEMFHRGILSREELELLLRVSDIPSFWREALIQLSYSVVTRVDVRRMYSLGVYDESDVYRKNLDLGYSPTDAKDLTDWIIASYAEKERNLTKSDILGMYRDGVLNEEETTGFLRALDYKESDISLLIIRQDLARQDEYEKTVKKEVRLGYLAGIYDRTQAFGLLAQLDPPAGYIENAVTLWDLEKRRRVKKPTLVNMRDFWQSGVITIPELKQEMTDMGYSDKYIEMYMGLWQAEYGEPE